MEAKYNVGDVLWYEPVRKTDKPLLLEILEVSPEFFKNTYLMRRYGSKSGATTYKAFDVVHNQCRLAKGSELTLYGS